MTQTTQNDPKEDLNRPKTSQSHSKQAKTIQTRPKLTLKDPKQVNTTRNDPKQAKAIQKEI